MEQHQLCPVLLSESECVSHLAFGCSSKVSGTQDIVEPRLGQGLPWHCRSHRQDRDSRLPEDLLGRGTGQNLQRASPSVGPDDEQVDFMLLDQVFQSRPEGSLLDQHFMRYARQASGILDFSCAFLGEVPELFVGECPDFRLHHAVPRQCDHMS